MMKIYSFGKLSDGRKAGLYVLRNSRGMSAEVTDYGAALVRLLVPDSTGKPVDVVLGHDDAAGYEDGSGSIGGTVGRFANRIGNARFFLNGKRYSLTANDGTNALHGGRDPYEKRLWTAVIPFGKISSGSVAAKAGAVESMNDGYPAYVQENSEGDSITFMLKSPDGDQGFPGKLIVEVTYTLTNDNELHIDYKAVSDRDTALNLTNHSYFNLSGHSSGTVRSQICEIKADHFTPSDSGLLPTGELRSVEGTPMDFRVAKPIGRDIDEDDVQLKFAGGYDHNFAINGWDSPQREYREAALLISEETGICMTVLTDLPGMQMYTANFMDNEPGKNDVYYVKNSGVCFETQFFPDAVNKDNFPGGIIRAGEEYRSRTTYRFG